MDFFKKVNSDSYKISEFSNDDYEYLDQYVFDDFENYKDSDNFIKEMYKLHRSTFKMR